MASNRENSVQIELLSEDNYSTWKMQMEALLIRIGLWEYVNGDIKLSSVNDDKGRANWLSNDREAKAELILSIKPSELKHIRECETSHDTWTTLESIYESRDRARKTTLLKQLVLTCNQKKNDSDVADHATEFWNIVSKLEEMNVEIDDELLVIMFLQSLPSSYENFRYAMESRNELPSLEILKIKIMDEIEVRSKNSGSESKEENSKNDIECIDQPL